MTRLFVYILLVLFLLMGCSSVYTGRHLPSPGKSHVYGAPRIISVSDKLTVHLYDSLSSLRAAYMYQGGDTGKIRKVVGFYSESNNTIHCLKWDYYSCGHELFHALQYKGDNALLVEKGYEHFKENNYTSP